MRQILFVCTGNTCRSPMAEGIFKALAAGCGADMQADSCGLGAFAGDEVTPHAVTAAAEYGADIRAHRAKPCNPERVGAAERIYAMTDGHRQALCRGMGVPPEKVQVLNVPDPFGGALEDYRRCAANIAAACREILAEGKANE